MAKLSSFKKFVIIAGALIVLEGIYVVFFSAASSNKSPQDVIREALQGVGNAGIERQVQIAVQMFRADNNGKLPENLGQLVPKYLASQPIDPQTKQPLAYRVDGNNFYVGSGGSTIVMTDEGGRVRALTGQAAQEEMSVQVFLKALSEPPNARLVHYDPSNKRDPFRPFDLSEKMGLDVARTPLQGVEVKELALTAVVEQAGEAKAVIETPDGQGHTVKKGDKVGLNGGEIVEINPDRIVVLESMQDFTGETKTKTVEILRKGQTRETAQGVKRKPNRL